MFQTNLKRVLMCWFAVEPLKTSTPRNYVFTSASQHNTEMLLLKSKPHENNYAGLSKVINDNTIDVIICSFMSF